MIKISHKTTWFVRYHSSFFSNRCRSSKKIYGSGLKTSIISNDDLQDVLKIVKSLEDSEILLKGVTQTIHIDISKQNKGFLSMLLGTLGVSLLGDLLTKNLSRKGAVRAGKGTIRAGEGIKKKL